MVCIILRKGQIKWCKICLFLIILLNNVLNYQEKNEVIKEYGLEDEEFEERMRDMCNLGEVIELEALEKGTQKERIRSIKNIMTKLKMSFKEAIQFLEIPEDEVLELEDAFNNDLKNKN